jgi:hypothetical protein
MSYFKGIIATAILGAVVFGVFLMQDYHDSCLDICLFDRPSLAVLGGLLGAAIGAFQGGLLAASAAFGVCKRAIHFILAGVVFLLITNFVGSLSMGTPFQLFALDSLWDLALGAVMGLVYTAGANGWRSLRSW